MKRGFTLAETMIVISILGILFALMIPVLDRTKPDESTLKYRKAFFGLEEAVRNLANDTKLYPEGDFMQPATIPSGATYNEVFCQNIANTLNTIGKIDCHTSSAKYVKNKDLKSDQVNFRVAGGMSFGGVNNEFENEVENTTAPESLTICIDVDGFNNSKKNVAGVNNLGCAPSSRSAEQRDQFRIRIDRFGRVYTGSDTGKNNWKKENSMLINPAGVTASTKKLTASEKSELIQDGTEGSDKTAPTNPTCRSGYTWNGKNCVLTSS